MNFVALVSVLHVQNQILQSIESIRFKTTFIYSRKQKQVKSTDWLCMGNNVWSTFEIIVIAKCHDQPVIVQIQSNFQKFTKVNDRPKNATTLIEKLQIGWPRTTKISNDIYISGQCMHVR